MYGAWQLCSEELEKDLTRKVLKAVHNGVDKEVKKDLTSFSKGALYTGPVWNNTVN
jgi:hypothetical protein